MAKSIEQLKIEAMDAFKHFKKVMDEAIRKNLSEKDIEKFDDDIKEITEAFKKELKE